MIRVSFACNDPSNGNWSGRVEKIEIHGHYGCDIALESRVEGGSAFSLVESLLARHRGGREDRTFRISGTAFPCFGWTSWYGNWCWDMTRMSAIEVIRLIHFLRDKGWYCEESSSTFVDAYEAGLTISPACLHEALSRDPAFSQETAR